MLAQAPELKLLPPSDDDSDDDGGDPLQIGDKSIKSHYVEFEEEEHKEQKKKNRRKQESSKIRKRDDGLKMEGILRVMSPPKSPKHDDQSPSPRDIKSRQHLETPGLSDPCYALNINDTSDADSNDDEIVIPKERNPKQMDKSFNKDKYNLEISKDIKLIGERRRLNFNVDCTSYSIRQDETKVCSEPISHPFENNIQPDGSHSHFCVPSTSEPISNIEDAPSQMFIQPPQEEPYPCSSIIERTLKNRPELTIERVTQQPYEHPHPPSPNSEYPHPTSSVPPNQIPASESSVVESNLEYPNPQSSDGQQQNQYPQHQSSDIQSSSDARYSTVSANTTSQERVNLPSSSFPAHNKRIYAKIYYPEIDTDSSNITTYSETQNIPTLQDQHLESKRSSVDLQERAVSADICQSFIFQNNYSPERNVQPYDVNPHQSLGQQGIINLNDGSSGRWSEENQVTHASIRQPESIVISQVSLSLIARSRDLFEQQSSSLLQPSAEESSDQGPQCAKDSTLLWKGSKNTAADEESLEETVTDSQPNISNVKDAAQVISHVQKEILPPMTGKCSFDKNKSDILATIIYDDQSTSSEKFDVLSLPIKNLVCEYLRNLEQKSYLKIVQYYQTEDYLIMPIPVTNQAGPSNAKTRWEIEDIEGLHSQDHSSLLYENYVETGIQIIVLGLIPDDRSSVGYRYLKTEKTHFGGAKGSQFIPENHQTTEIPTERLFLYWCVKCAGYFTVFDINMHPCFQRSNPLLQFEWTSQKKNTG